MAKGIIYIMTTVVPGLIKIGKTGSANYEQRMYQLEHNGYSNVTGLKRSFAIEVEEYEDKETLLHTIFEKSRVADTELFSVDVNIARQLLSSFDGTVIYPKDESKKTIFEQAAENSKSMLIPDGEYKFKRKKKSDNKTVEATAVIRNGNWTIKSGSILGMNEGPGVPQIVKDFRKTMVIDMNGKLLEDANLGVCTPTFAGIVVLNQSNNGWAEWHTLTEKPIDIYRIKNQEE